MELHDLWEQIVKLFLNTKSRVLGLTTRRWCLMDGTCALAASVRILHPLHNMSRHRYDSRKHEPPLCSVVMNGLVLQYKFADDKVPRTDPSDRYASAAESNSITTDSSSTQLLCYLRHY